MVTSTKRTVKTILLSLTLLFGITAFAQETAYVNLSNNYTDDSIRVQLDKRPRFSAFKDNFGALGTTVGSKSTKENSDAIFQLSIMQRLTNSNMIWNTNLFFQLTFTSYMDVLLPSYPIRDISVNPGIGLAKDFIKDGKVIGKGYLMIEHESNGFGEEGGFSRSWNKLSLATTMQVTKNVELQGKAWFPVIDGRHSQHLLRYQGVFFAGTTLSTNDKRLNFSAMVTPTYRKNLSANSKYELNYRLSKKDPIFLILQYYNGYGENLLDYDLFKSRLRMGFSIKPDGFYIF
jgi:Outer membrane phospholipase A